MERQTEKRRCQRRISPFALPALGAFPVLLPRLRYRSAASATSPSWDFLHCLWGSVGGAKCLFLHCFIMLLQSRTTAG